MLSQNIYTYNSLKLECDLTILNIDLTKSVMSNDQNIIISIIVYSLLLLIIDYYLDEF